MPWKLYIRNRRTASPIPKFRSISKLSKFDSCTPKTVPLQYGITKKGSGLTSARFFTSTAVNVKLLGMWQWPDNAVVTCVVWAKSRKEAVKTLRPRWWPVGEGEPASSAGGPCQTPWLCSLFGQALLIKIQILKWQDPNKLIGNIAFSHCPARTSTFFCRHWWCSYNRRIRLKVPHCQQPM